MAKFQSPLLGYNNNVRHKGRVFHIQTEDSGVNHPHVITHLFMDGGRILKSVKKSYAEHVGIDGMSEIVRGLMKEQHKAMFIALRDGQFDHLVEGAAAPAPAPSGPKLEEKPKEPKEKEKEAAAAPLPPPPPPVSVEAPKTIETPPRRPSVETPRSVEQPEIAGQVAPPPASITEPKGTLFSQPPPTPGRLALAEEDDEEAAAALASEDGTPVSAEPKTTRQPEPPVPISRDAPPASVRERRAPQPPPSAQELTLDFDALERANDATPLAASSLFQSTDLPPPPKNLFSKEPGTGGAYRTIETDPRPESTRERSGSRPPASRPGRTPQQPAANQRSSQPAQRVAAPRTPSENRYAPARPAAIFGAAAKQSTPPSIFSDELVSDKSLDEVILSYLAEDLEPPRRK